VKQATLTALAPQLWGIVAMAVARTVGGPPAVFEATLPSPNWDATRPSVMLSGSPLRMMNLLESVQSLSR